MDMKTATFSAFQEEGVRSKLTHDADDQSPVKWSHGHAEEKKSNRHLNCTYSNEIHRLCNEIELIRELEIGLVNVPYVLSCAVYDFGYDDALACNALRTVRR